MAKGKVRHQDGAMGREICEKYYYSQITYLRRQLSVCFSWCWRVLGQKNTSGGQGRSWCQCSCQEERYDPGQWPGRRRGRGREMLTSSSTSGVKVFWGGGSSWKSTKIAKQILVCEFQEICTLHPPSPTNIHTHTHRTQPPPPLNPKPPTKGQVHDKSLRKRST